MINPNLRMSILENADDSLKNTVLELLSANDEKLSSPSFIKNIVLSLHHSVELYLKFLLMQENSILLYDLKNENNVNYILEGLRALRKHNENVDAEKIELENILLKRSNIKTIDYTKIVKMCSILFEFNTKTSTVFNELATLRNSFYHFGFDKNDSVFKVFGLIIEVLKEVQENISCHFAEYECYFEYNDYIDASESFIEGIHDFMKNRIIGENKEKYVNFVKKLYENMSDIEEFAEIKIDNSSDVLDIEVNYKNECLQYELSTFLSTYSKAFITLETEGPICFIYDFDDETFYVYDVTDSRYFDFYDLDKGKFWIDDLRGKKCKSFHISKKSFLPNYLKNKFTFKAK